jgi:hypothetical protein
VTLPLWLIGLVNYVWFALLIMAIWNLGFQHWFHIQPIDFWQAVVIRLFGVAASTDSVPQPYFDKYGDLDKI